MKLNRWATQTSPKNGGELRCPRRASSSRFL
jgi:hypothetical protein